MNILIKLMSIVSLVIAPYISGGDVKDAEVESRLLKEKTIRTELPVKPVAVELTKIQ